LTCILLPGMTHSTSKLSFLHPYVFVTYFFSLKQKVSPTETIEQQLQSIFFPSCHPEWNTNCGWCCICWCSSWWVFGCTDRAGQAFTSNFFCALPRCYTPFGL